MLARPEFAAVTVAKAGVWGVLLEGVRTLSAKALDPCLAAMGEAAGRAADCKASEL